MSETFKKIEQEILALNPWAKDLWSQYQKNRSYEWDAAYEQAAGQASLDRWMQGRSAWNSWATDMAAIGEAFDFDKISRRDPGVDRAYTAKYLMGRSIFFENTFDEVADFSGFQLGDTWFGIRRREGDKLRVKACRFLNEANFDGATISGLFDSVVFSKDASFVGSEFSYLEARSVIFRSQADFTDARFQHILDQSSNFSDALFIGSALFTGARFEGSTIRFHGAQFKGDTDFTDASFLAIPNADRYEVDFMRTSFAGPVSFVRATFANHLYFAETQFDQDADFSNAEVQASIRFNMFDVEANTRFGGKANFQNFKATVGTAIFFKVDFVGEVDFTGAEFQGGCVFQKINFQSGEIGLKAAKTNL